MMLTTVGRFSTAIRGSKLPLLIQKGRASFSPRVTSTRSRSASVAQVFGNRQRVAVAGYSTASAMEANATRGRTM